tara:strand:- start:185 stop:802 length:618 start_codon:yes stop_codon:yes gene_type:complete
MAKDEFNLKEKTLTNSTIDCGKSDKVFSKKMSFINIIVSCVKLVIKKLDFFKILPKDDEDKYMTKSNRCLTPLQITMINKQKEIYRQAILFIFKSVIMCLCVIHLFYFSNTLFGKDILPKLLCSFLILYDWKFYVSIIIIFYYIVNFEPANKRYTKHIIKTLNDIKKQLFKIIPVFDKYMLFISKPGIDGKVLTHYYSVEGSCSS